MKTPPLLSILTPSIPSRIQLLSALSAEIEGQRNALANPAEVEHIAFLDTRGARSIGQKRDDLVQLAQGHFVAFVDDDDRIEPAYVSALTDAIRNAHDEVDVVTFEQYSLYNDIPSRIVFRLGSPNDPYAPHGVTRRNAWHVCAWKKELAQRHHFPNTNYGEDWAWARHLCAEARAELHIPAILHRYIHHADTTAAPAPH